MSVFHWINLLLTPMVMLWPELWPSPSYSLWLCEIMFLLDILRKCLLKKQKSQAADSYDIFVEYVRSNLIIDLIPLLPSIFSGMDQKFAFLKILRVNEIYMLHFSLTYVLQACSSQKSKSELKDVEFAFGIISKITILLHYLSCLWIHIGGEDYLDYEPGFLPWQFANKDLEGMSRYQLYIFSTYWVCTVITTVGYGDYHGGTTLEYEATLFLMIFGVVVFSLLQLTVTRLMGSKYYTFPYYM